MSFVARALLLTSFALTACGPTGRSVRTGAKLPAKPADCDIFVALDGKLDRPYEIIGLVEAEGTSSIVALIPVLQSEGCKLGADALVNIEQAVSSGYNAIAQGQGGNVQGVGTSYETFHLTATAVRFTSSN